jgi:hypothetical protein
VTGHDPYDEDAQSLAHFISTFADAHHDADAEPSITNYEYEMLQQAAEQLSIDEEVRHREAERVSSPDERLSAATRDWGLVRTEDPSL